jgi:hypothetical protein
MAVSSRGRQGTVSSVPFESRADGGARKEGAASSAPREDNAGGRSKQRPYEGGGEDAGRRGKQRRYEGSSQGRALEGD